MTEALTAQVCAAMHAATDLAVVALTALIADLHTQARQAPAGPCREQLRDLAESVAARREQLRRLMLADYTPRTIDLTAAPDLGQAPTQVPRQERTPQPSAR